MPRILGLNAHTAAHSLESSRTSSCMWFIVIAGKRSQLDLYIYNERIHCICSSWPIVLWLSHPILSEIHRIRPTDSDDHITMTSSPIHLSLVGKLQPLFLQKCNYVVNSIRAGKAHNWYLTHGCISPRRDLIDAIIYFCKCKTVSGPDSSLCMSLGENGACFFLHGL